MQDWGTYVLLFATLFVWNIFHSKNNSARSYKNVRTSSCKVPMLLQHFKKRLIFSIEFQKNPQISNFMKICPVGDELFYLEDRQTDSRNDESDSRFSQFRERI